MFVLVSQNSFGSWTEYYSGKSYIQQGQHFAVIARRDEAKVYKSEKIANNAADRLTNKVGEVFIVINQ